MKRPTLFLLLALAAAPLARAEPLALSQAIDTVLARYPTIGAAQAAVDAARGRTEQSNAGRLPQLSAEGAYTYLSLRPYVAFTLPTGTSAFYETVQNGYNATLNLRQLLTDFGRTDALVALARAGEISAKDALDQARSQLGYQVIEAWYRVLLLRQAVGVADEEIVTLREALRVSGQKLAGGTATKFDVLTTQVRLVTAQNSRTDTLAAQRREESALRQLLGWPRETPLELAGDFDVSIPLPDLPAAVAEGLRNRPEARLAQDSEIMAASRVDAADRENRPVLAAQATGGVQNGDLPALYANKGYLTAGVSVSVPIFTGNRIAGRRIEAQADRRAAEARTDEIGRVITTDVEDAFTDLDAARARLANADTLVAQSQEALGLARSRYANGVITNFELLDAQSSAQIGRAHV